MSTSGSGSSYKARGVAIWTTAAQSATSAATHTHSGHPSMRDVPSS